MGVIDADVAVPKTSCQFARTFVRYEDVRLMLTKGNKRIRTGACGS